MWCVTYTKIQGEKNGELSLQICVTLMFDSLNGEVVRFEDASCATKQITHFYSYFKS